MSMDMAVWHQCIAFEPSQQVASDSRWNRCKCLAKLKTGFPQSNTLKLSLRLFNTESKKPINNIRCHGMCVCPTIVSRRRRKDFVNDYFMICALEDAACKNARSHMACFSRVVGNQFLQCFCCLYRAAFTCFFSFALQFVLNLNCFGLLRPWSLSCQEDAPAHPGEIVTVRSLCEAFATSSMTKAGCYMYTFAGCCLAATWVFANLPPRFNLGAL